MNICSKCDTEVKEGDQFCGNCGAKLIWNANTSAKNDIGTANSTADLALEDLVKYHNSLGAVFFWFGWGIAYVMFCSRRAQIRTLLFIRDNDRQYTKAIKDHLEAICHYCKLLTAFYWVALGFIILYLIVPISAIENASTGELSGFLIWYTLSVVIHILGIVMLNNAKKLLMRHLAILNNMPK